MNVTIVDYQSGNISSVINSFTEAAKGKVNLEVTSDLNKIKWDMKDISFTSNRVLSENDVTSLLKKKEDAEKKNLIKAVEEIKEKLKPIWVESQTIKHKGVSVAEFQIHRHRKSYKFRFNMFNLRKLL